MKESSAPIKTISDADAEEIIKAATRKTTIDDYILPLNNKRVILDNKDDFLNHPYIKSLMVNRTETQLKELINNILTQIELSYSRPTSQMLGTTERVDPAQVIRDMYTILRLGVLTKGYKVEGGRRTRRSKKKTRKGKRSRVKSSRGKRSRG